MRECVLALEQASKIEKFPAGQAAKGRGGAVVLRGSGGYLDFVREGGVWGSCGGVGCEEWVGAVWRGGVCV